MSQREFKDIFFFHFANNNGKQVREDIEQQIYNFIGMRTSANLNDLMMSLAGRTDSKLGCTTTVKEQVDDIEVGLC